MQKLNGIYKPSSSDLFCDTFIPQEAVFVQSEQIELLKAEEDLTLTFDGTTIRINESFYTAHVTTPSWRSFFLDGHKGSGESHNRKWITDNLMKVSQPTYDSWQSHLILQFACRQLSPSVKVNGLPSFLITPM